MRKQTYSYGYVLSRIDLADQPLGRFHLLQLLRSRRKANLLIAKFAQYWALVISLHGPPHSLLRSLILRSSWCSLRIHRPPPCQPAAASFDLDPFQNAMAD